MEMIEIDIWDLKPFAAPEDENSDYNALCDSIRANGIMNLPTISRNHKKELVVVIGRWRILAARAVGITKIPAVLTHKPLTQQQIDIIRGNT